MVSHVTVHHLPVNDLIQHEDVGTDCICGPDVEWLINQYGGTGKLITHHSLDAREFCQEGCPCGEAD